MNNDKKVLLIKRGDVTIHKERHPEDRRFFMFIVRDKDQILKEYPSNYSQGRAEAFFEGYTMAKTVWQL